MRTYKTVQVEQHVLDGCVCNQCGGPMLPVGHEHGASDVEAYGLHAEVDGGFSSEALCDMTGYSFDLCEPCLARLFAGFKIPVTVNEKLLNGSNLVQNPALLQYAIEHEHKRIAAYVKGEKPPKYEPPTEALDTDPSPV